MRTDLKPASITEWTLTNIYKSARGIIALKIIYWMKMLWFRKKITEWMDLLH